MRCFLEIPLEFTAAGVQSHDAVGEQVVSRSNAAARRPGVARRQIDAVSDRIDRGCRPDRAAAVLPRTRILGIVGFFTTEVPPWAFARASRGERLPVHGIGSVPAPLQRTVAKRIGAERPADSELAAGDPDQHGIPVDQRRHGDAVTCPVVGDRGRPSWLAGLRVEGHELRVELSDDHEATSEGDSAVHRAATKPEMARKRRAFPQDVAGLRVDGQHAVIRRAQVHDALHDERRRLKRTDGARLNDVRGNESRDVAGIDAGRRPEAPVAKVAAEGGPIDGAVR